MIAFEKLKVRRLSCACPRMEEGKQGMNSPPLHTSSLVYGSALGFGDGAVGTLQNIVRFLTRPVDDLVGLVATLTEELVGRFFRSLDDAVRALGDILETSGHLPPQL